MERINEFRGEYSFLSNFYRSPVEIGGLKYSCVECAFQAQKCINPKDKLQFTTIGPVAAKKLGRSIDLRSDWEDIKVSIMWECLIDKFTRYDFLKRKLLDTGDAYLQEGNTWGDKFWGVDLRSGKGDNKLGQLLMSVRDVLRNGDN